ncbi:hypothetical protein MQE23_00020 [Streptomyces sp. HP-A2021]|uniref:hypothetical protein n=1 Tax=Streptomyces sp. HP-A2021 TaxID=2927875 RepID=UPI001FAE7F93|nr:hypothetical protein [Streptomyces sp. HP-A2021]UOB07599.1 hypothetical protein MQE23_00020 [Streptomyces sp. HP-A2021]
MAGLFQKSDGRWRASDDTHIGPAGASIILVIFLVKETFHLAKVLLISSEKDSIS